MGVTILGTVGFWLLEHTSFAEALYMTVMTVSTVGAYDRPLSEPGRAFITVLTMLGVAAVGYALFSINTWMIQGTLMEIMGQRRIGRQLQKLKDHVIVCGAGRIGGLVAEDLRQAGAEFVVIDQDSERVQELIAGDILAVEGYAGDEEALELAGIARARTLISVVRSDADNLYITITARSLNPDIIIVVRAEEEATVTKLKRVGATRVVAPYHLGAMRIANAVLRPAVTDVMEMAATGSDVLGLQIAEIAVATGSRVADKTLKDAQLRQELGVMIIAIRSAEGITAVNPSIDEPLAPGSLLVALGTQEQLDRLARWSTA